MSGWFRVELEASRLVRRLSELTAGVALRAGAPALAEPLVDDGTLARREVQRAPSFPGREIVQAETLIPARKEFGWHIGGAVLARLDGVAASAGSACHAGRVELSPALEAMGEPEVGIGAVRFSLGRETTQDEIDTVIEALCWALPHTPLSQSAASVGHALIGSRAKRALAAAYRPVLGATPRRPWATVGLAALVLASAAVPAMRLGSEFTPISRRERHPSHAERLSLDLGRQDEPGASADLGRGAARDEIDGGGSAGLSGLFRLRRNRRRWRRPREGPAMAARPSLHPIGSTVHALTIRRGSG